MSVELRRCCFVLQASFAFYEGTYYGNREVVKIIERASASYQFLSSHKKRILKFSVLIPTYINRPFILIPAVENTVRRKKTKTIIRGSHLMRTMKKGVTASLIYLFLS